MRHRHTMPFGAELGPAGTRFALWAPSARTVALCIEGRAPIPLELGADGWCRRLVSDCPAGTRYRYRIDRELDVPDPAARFLPDGVHGASVVVDPTSFEWGTQAWRGRPWHETVLYELHVGTFSPSGDYRGVEQRLDHLAELGVTALELMPLAATPGDRNWGYDGVALFAPDRAYGTPDELKALIRAAHAREMLVFLDVVYNHFGPEGAYLHRFAAPMFTARHDTPWGAAIDYDGQQSRAVRELMIHNALYWLEEYRFDGLRLDSAHQFFDESEPHIFVELAERVRAQIGDERAAFLVLENDDNRADLLARRPDGTPLSYVAQWNDDIHHALHVVATGETGGYYSDYADAPLEQLGRCLTRGFAYQGEPSRHRGGAIRGQPSGHLPTTAFVGFAQNHDQIGNRAYGERLSELTSPDALRAVTAIVLLAPHIPMLFMGQEWAASTPFQFFCDFEPALHDSVREGRRREFASFPAFRDPAARNRIPDPNAIATFERSKLRWTELAAPEHHVWLALHRELIRLRHVQVVPLLPALSPGSFDVDAHGVLRATWDAGQVSLSLCANLRDTAAPGRPPPGERLWASHEGLDTFPPWAVTWTLRR